MLLAHFVGGRVVLRALRTIRNRERKTHVFGNTLLLYPAGGSLLSGNNRISLWNLLRNNCELRLE